MTSPPQDAETSTFSKLEFPTRKATPAEGQRAEAMCVLTSSGVLLGLKCRCPEMSMSAAVAHKAWNSVPVQAFLSRLLNLTMPGVFGGMRSTPPDVHAGLHNVSFSSFYTPPLDPSRCLPIIVCGAR